MARRKKPENETQEEAEIRKRLEAVANHATRSEKTSWQRKQNNLDKLIVDKLHPIEDDILKLVVKKNRYLDEIETVRLEMVYTCVHPIDLLVDNGDETVTCKFCGIDMSVPNGRQET